ncbi:BTB/POZ domain-containing protein 17 isoform X2 [Physeter macrocephalus]|uniref:BTB/POZ domain-containing protein 17 n=1 Tax=Physeter macrocephalus TaxID=9755 RepID=A0A2Y9T5E6_PHYMC|nr:BTB/POZ domain-containing protein 17 isoform X2 [Physeter catodon]|eukprot:XP_023986146.1 BTB/POZ domain-containing protein 17 isoform X2 [Physeter catodon]
MLRLGYTKPGSWASFWAILTLVGLVTRAAQKTDVGGESTGTSINHSQTLLQRLQELLRQGNASDVVLRVQATGTDEVRVFHAHRLLLGLHSELFRELLSNQSEVVLQEPRDGAAVFDKFIRYLYCGELIVLLAQAIPLHRLATKYGVSSLQRGVADYMRAHLAGGAGPAVGWYHYAVSTGDEALRQSCLQFLAWNLSAVAGSAEWGAVSPELLAQLLPRSDLVLQDELELFHALEAWLGRARPPPAVAERALRSIRYPMIPPAQLFQLQARSAALARHGPAVADLLLQAYQFHAASPLHYAKFFDVNGSSFLPRNYLAPAWGAPWVINNPARDDRSTSFQTQLGPSGHDSGRRVTWNVLFSPRWLPVSLRPVYADAAGTALPLARPEDGRPRLVVTPASSGGDAAGVSFQKTVLVGTRQHGRLLVRHAYSFHQSSEEAGDFLAHADLQRRNSEYLVENALHLHLIVKPVYHPLIRTPK